jgi:serine protease Do
MKFLSSKAVLCAVLVLCAPPASAAENNPVAYPRRNPVVEAVAKTQESIVTVKVVRPNAAKDTVGTGVIIDERGYIVTNRHVVGTSPNIKVRLFSGTELPATVLWSDSSYDLAVLRIDAGKKLAALKLAPAADLMVGETVIAVGHPFGYTNTVSTGIISALGREIAMPSGDTLQGLIQTNASINPGNSGGPLLNINGELIGINVALRDGAQGIAFAINAGTVKSALSRHLSSEKIAGIHHGLSCAEKILGETGDRQRVVVADYRGAATDLESGDEILAVGDRYVTNAFDVERAFWDKHAGDKVPLTVVREGKELNVTLVLSAVQGAGGVASVQPPSEHRLNPALHPSVPVASPQR